MVWVEQPVGTGFSQGTPTATNEDEVAAQFLGFFKNFVDTFALQGRKVFITGESYAGYYVPYIANAMLNANDTTYYDVQSIMVYDPSTSTDTVQEQSKSPSPRSPCQLPLLPNLYSSRRRFRRRKPQSLPPQLHLLGRHPFPR